MWAWAWADCGGSSLLRMAVVVVGCLDGSPVKSLENFEKVDPRVFTSEGIGGVVGLVYGM
jgi:hypothetical protein